MNLEQRSEILPLLYRLQGELNVLSLRCHEHSALAVGVNVQAMKNICNETLDDFQPDKPADLEFSRRKF